MTKISIFAHASGEKRENLQKIVSFYDFFTQLARNLLEKKRY